MNESFKLFSLLVLGVVSLLMTAYSVIGVLQAGMLYSGERALRNLQVWGGATALFLICAVACFAWAWRLMRRHRPAFQRPAKARAQNRADSKETGSAPAD